MCFFGLFRKFHPFSKAFLSLFLFLTSKERLSVEAENYFLCPRERILGPNAHKFCLKIDRYTFRTIKKIIQTAVLFSKRVQLTLAFGTP